MKQKQKVLYYSVLFFLSVYLIFSVIIETFHLVPNFLKINKIICYWILAIFILEILVKLMISKNIIQTIKKEWISILAIFVSFSLIKLLNVYAGMGLFGATKIILLTKALKATKGLKVFKAMKGIKIMKSYKLGKKTIKEIKTISKDG